MHPGTHCGSHLPSRRGLLTCYSNPCMSLSFTTPLTSLNGGLFFCSGAFLFLLESTRWSPSLFQTPFQISFLLWTCFLKSSLSPSSCSPNPSPRSSAIGHIHSFNTTPFQGPEVLIKPSQAHASPASFSRPPFQFSLLSCIPEPTPPFSPQPQIQLPAG